VELIEVTWDLIDPLIEKGKLGRNEFVFVKTVPRA